MEFRIAETFTDSLARLTAEEQKAAKTTAFDLQVNPAQPGLQMHRLDKPKDPNFLSVRAGSDLRIIVHRTEGSILLCYVDHHDRAYAWAERRKLETHPKTGAAQLVELRETVRDVVVPRYVEKLELPTPVELHVPMHRPCRGIHPAVTNPGKALFARMPRDELLGYGVPLEWLEEVQQADEHGLLMLADRLPAEAAEALLQLATGGKPSVSPVSPVAANPFDHPDARRRFRLMANPEELKRALEFPWDRWIVFLHPDQRQIVEREYGGPARVSGSAGTGKTIVALHRAVFLARAHPDARVLLTTFSPMLANALRARLRRLIGNEPRLAERLEVRPIDEVGERLHRAHFGPAKVAPREAVSVLLKEASEAAGDHRFSPAFVLSEWEQVVDAWQLQSWESYRDVPRLGRKTRLPESHRAILWSIFERVRLGLADRGLITVSGLFTQLAAALAAHPTTPPDHSGRVPGDLSPGTRRQPQSPTMPGDLSPGTETQPPPYDFLVVDESQDMSVAHLRFFAALGGRRPDALFFAGDLGQRIFQQPFSWLALGVDIRGRSRTLRVNYRTSHQIRTQADRLLGPVVSDADGNQEKRDHTVSVFNGPAPEVRVLESQQEESSAVAAWILERAEQGVAPQEFGVFVRSAAELERTIAVVERTGMPFKVLDESLDTVPGHLSIGTMHLAKGLEFRAVVVMACDDEIIPSQERIETVGDEADLQEVYDTERHLLYVACTRARDHLLVTGVAPASEFLEDLRA